MGNAPANAGRPCPPCRFPTEQSAGYSSFTTVLSSLESRNVSGRWPMRNPLRLGAHSRGGGEAEVGSAADRVVRFRPMRPPGGWRTPVLTLIAVVVAGWVYLPLRRLGRPHAPRRDQGG